MHGHGYFNELGWSLTRPHLDRRGKPAWTGGNIGQALLGEVLSRVAVNTPPVTSRAAIVNGDMLRVKLPLAEGSVSKAVTSLVAHKFLREDLDVDLSREIDGASTFGRRRIPVRLNDERWFTIGVHIDQLHDDERINAHETLKLTAVATPIDDSTLLLAQPLTGKCSADDTDLVRGITGIVEKVIGEEVIRRRVEKDWLPWLGLGVAIGNPVFEGKVRSPYLDSGPGGSDRSNCNPEAKKDAEDKKWYDLGDRLVDALNIPVVVENDASVLAVRQLYGKEAADDDFALVLVTETGVGAAFAAGGRVYRGSRGMAGEIGHIKVAPQLPGWLPSGQNNGVGGRCSCGDGQGQHVDVLATPSRLRHTVKDGLLKNGGGIARNGTTDTGTGDDRLSFLLKRLPPDVTDQASELFEAAGRALGQGVAALTNVINPGQVIFILPESLKVPGRDSPDYSIKSRHAQGLREELDETFARRPSNFDDIQKFWDRVTFRRETARAASIRVVIEFIDHLSGLDGCPPFVEHGGLRAGMRETMVPIAAALAGGAVSTTAAASVFGGAIGAAFGSVARKAIRSRTLDELFRERLRGGGSMPTGETRPGDAAQRLDRAPWGRRPAESEPTSTS